jgi:5-methylcytosine-specific restriction endonuclease McrA
VKRSALKRNTPLRPNIKRRTKRWIVYSQVRSDVENRAKGKCEIRTEVCEIRGNQCHHLLPRSGGGPDSIANCVWICAPCHSHVHDHPTVSYENGWLISRYGRTE